MPKILVGTPREGTGDFQCHEDGSIRVYYPERLASACGENGVHIRLRGFLFMKWLELEGVRPILCSGEGDPV